HNKSFHSKGKKGENSTTEGSTPPTGSTGVVLQWMPDGSTQTRLMHPSSQAETTSFPSQQSSQSFTSGSLPPRQSSQSEGQASRFAQGEERQSKLPVRGKVKEEREDVIFVAKQGVG
ncbi:unnamed protein product, partial [Linum tenue]